MGRDQLTVLALRAGGEGPDAAQAREAVVRTAYADVWQLCAGLVDRQSADDLAQEAFLRAVGSLRRFRGDSSARTWLLAVARHTCLDEIRRRRRRRHRDEHLATSVVDHLPEAGDASGSSVVLDVLGRLDPERRAAFVLTQQLGLSYGEAAAVCECPTGTIRSRVARARADLVRLLADADLDAGSEQHGRAAAPPPAG